MSNRRDAVLVGIFLAFVGTAIWLPIEWEAYDGNAPVRSSQTHLPTRAWAWQLDRMPTWLEVADTPSGSRGFGATVHWPTLFIEQALILLLGGGLLTFVVRRERRRLSD